MFKLMLKMKFLHKKYKRSSRAPEIQSIFHPIKNTQKA